MNIIAILLICLGLFFFTAGTIGILRFPDFYTRLHAAGKCDSLASLLIIAGILCHLLQSFSFGNLLIGGKILMIAAFVFVASPTATHAITEAALSLGVAPWERPKKKRSA